MNRNVNSHFAVNPTNIDISRSTIDRNCTLKTSFNVGALVPFYIDEVLPGDSFAIQTSKVVRMPTLLTPIMDNIYLDTYFFFVPNRLVWNHWREFNGENTQSAWLPTTEYEVPQITAPDGGWSVGTLADYMGIPTGVSGLSVNALPFRAYGLICNEFFRDQNLTDPLSIPVDDSTVAGVNTGNYVTDVAKGGLPFKAAKYFDYFTGCLPSPQKGPDVTIPVASGGNLPVYSLEELTDPTKNTANMLLYRKNNSQYPYAGFINSNAQAGMEAGTLENSLGSRFSSYPANLWAISDGSVQAATINQLRLAFQIQKLYEKDARGGK